MLNKPAGVISASRDKKQTTVLDLVPQNLFRQDLFVAGRLDKDTEGFLIITNDGEFAHKMLSPKKHVFKTYFVILDQAVISEDINLFIDGIMLPDGHLTKPAVLEIPNPELPNEAIVKIREGRFHQIKLMFSKCGKNVQYLKRLQIGNLKLDPNLALGESRQIAQKELTDVFISDID